MTREYIVRRDKTENIEQAGILPFGEFFVNQTTGEVFVSDGETRPSGLKAIGVLPEYMNETYGIKK